MSTELNFVSYTESSGQSALPSYGDVERNGPPSYESRDRLVTDFKAEICGNINSVKKKTAEFVGTKGLAIFFTILFSIAVTALAIGAKYKDDCPEERLIPIYLIVAGSIALFRLVLTIVRHCCTKKNEDGEAEAEESTCKKVYRVLGAILDTFNFAWFIAGNVWVYRTFGDITSDPTAVNYCDSTLYWFAFWLITCTYIVIGACICLGCFCYVCCISCLDAARQKGGEMRTI